jgi:hypothetical protein
MVGAVALRPLFTDESALSLYQNTFVWERPAPSPQDAPLIPEVVEEREIKIDSEPCVYNRFGRIDRVNSKGIFVDSYR